MNKHDIKEELFCAGEHETDEVRKKLIETYRLRYPDIMPEIEPIVIEFWNYLPGTGENSVSGYDTESLIQAAFEGFDFSSVDEIANYVDREKRETVGPYKVLKILGKGGMGVVYLAEDPENQQKVAVKTLKATALIDPVYLDNEQKSLAKLNHSYIAHLKHTFTGDDGIQYIVMEYVDGVKIDDYCDNHQLTIRERVRLFKQLCEGVYHAHEHGLMHLDLKPMNILVKQENNTGVPKIIDFGISQIKDHIDQHLGHSTGTGTPAYMSPEQTNKPRNELTQKCDVYSLGVILHELLCGRVPLADELKNADSRKKMELVRKLSPRPLVDTAADLVNADMAKKRNTTPPKLMSQLKGELTWIVTKALAKDPADRYSLQALIADLEAFLDRREVSQGKPYRWYRWMHYLKAHQHLVSTAATLAIAVMMLSVGVRTNMALAAKNAKIALLEEARAENGQNLVNVLLEQASPFFGPERKETLSLDVLLERLSEKLNDPEAKKDRKRNFDQRLMLGRTLEDLNHLDRAVKELTSLRDDVQSWYGDDSREYYEVLSYLETYRAIQNPNLSDQSLLEQAIPQAAEIFGPTHKTTLRMHAARGHILLNSRQHSLDDALTDLNQVLDNTDFNKTLLTDYTYSSMLNRGNVYLQKGQYRRANRDLKRLKKLYLDRFKENDPFVGRINYTQGLLCLNREDFPRAEKFMNTAKTIFSNTLGPDHPDTQKADFMLAFRLPAAQGGCSGLIAQIEKELAGTNLTKDQRISHMSQLVDCLIKAKAWDQAEPVARQNWEEALAHNGADSFPELVTRLNRQCIRYGKGDQKGAQQEIDLIFTQAEKINQRKAFEKGWRDFLKTMR
ncbi:serine/threonine-protein kinase [Acanthopleuribacter pedis]|uniref:Serine/threonine protein kinase n=1 Tax=Acanthopleuribacter pedis TaxID=442870 RepID=A0A8J7QBH5_9BACT|nr:serine/threonine-protein kinase [Acanthopleuribacter pedis]MBO1320895.1 serine/threonine protein kinase [Acanthopleuribacter pedis]